ncbi:MAG: hypothetical protein ABEJ27_04540 [Halodesulfurarchaeum sp.]
MPSGGARQILGTAKDASPTDGPLAILLGIPLALGALLLVAFVGVEVFVDLWFGLDSLVPGFGVFGAILVFTGFVTLGLFVVFRVGDRGSR